MRARAAYIHSLGTTGILIASALLMMAIVSTIVAFRSWPVTGGSTDVQSVPLSPAQLSSSTLRKAPSRPAHRARTRQNRAASTRGLLKVRAPQTAYSTPHTIPMGTGTRGFQQHQGTVPGAPGSSTRPPAQLPPSAGDPGPVGSVTRGTPLQSVGDTVDGVLSQPSSGGGLPLIGDPSSSTIPLQ